MPPRPQKSKEWKQVHASADYYEALFRARFVRAMRKVREQTSINELAMLMGNKRQVKDVIPRARILEALGPCETVVKDALVKGVRLGTQKVNDLA